MDISTVVVVLVMIALSIGAIAWMEIHSRRDRVTGSSDESNGFGRE